MAIAHAVMQYLIETIKCKTLFITHYPIIALDLEQRVSTHTPSFLPSLFRSPVLAEGLIPVLTISHQQYKDVSCHHMGYIEQHLPSGEPTINFTYKLSPGMAKSSFGIECGRLAHMPDEVLTEARKHAERMRELMEARRVANKPRKMAGLIKGCLGGGDAETVTRALEDMVVFCKLSQKEGV